MNLNQLISHADQLRDRAIPFISYTIQHGERNFFIGCKFQMKCKTFNNSFSRFYRVIMWQLVNLLALFSFLLVSFPYAAKKQERVRARGEEGQKHSQTILVKKCKLRKQWNLKLPEIKPRLARSYLHLDKLPQQFFERQLCISGNCFQKCNPITFTHMSKFVMSSTIFINRGTHSVTTNDRKQW